MIYQGSKFNPNFNRCENTLRSDVDIYSKNLNHDREVLGKLKQIFTSNWLYPSS